MPIPIPHPLPQPHPHLLLEVGRRLPHAVQARISHCAQSGERRHREPWRTEDGGCIRFPASPELRPHLVLCDDNRVLLAHKRGVRGVRPRKASRGVAPDVGQTAACIIIDIRQSLLRSAGKTRKKDAHLKDEWP